MILGFLPLKFPIILENLFVKKDQLQLMEFL